MNDIPVRSPASTTLSSLAWNEEYGIVFFILAIVFFVLFLVAALCTYRCNSMRKAADIQADIAETELVRYVRFAYFLRFENFDEHQCEFAEKLDGA